MVSGSQKDVDSTPGVVCRVTVAARKQISERNNKPGASCEYQEARDQY